MMPAAVISVGMRIVRALLCGVTALTLVLVLWTLGASADFYRNGSVLLLPSLALGVIGGFAAGFFAAGKWRILIYAAAAVCACFWIFAVSWWAQRP